MACPFFLPTAPLAETGWKIPPRAPLGVLCAGECHAEAAPMAADGEWCNFGYARGACPRFPVEAPYDAVRFAKTDGAVLYVFERDHVPVRSGVVKPSREPGILERQAAMFAL